MAPFTATSDTYTDPDEVYTTFTGSVTGGTTVTVTVAFQLSPDASPGHAHIGLGPGPYFSEIAVDYR